MPEATTAVEPTGFAAALALAIAVETAWASLRPGALVRRPRLEIDPSTEPRLPARDPATEAPAHAVVRYRRGVRTGCAAPEAVQRTLLAVGRPIALASAMLVLGFGSVAVSEFATLRQFGVLSAWTLGVCALADLVLLPALLVRSRT